MTTVPAQIWKGASLHIERSLEPNSEGQIPNSLVFRFSGPFTARDMYAALTPAALKKLFETEPTPRHPVSVNIFDLSEVPYMDSCGLGLIVGHFVRCQNRGIQFIVAGVGPRVLQLLKTTKTDHLFRIAASLDEAVRLSHRKTT